mmetsp:Transcript_61688/g.144713  ORF Transcript_61688/g.144713 Transcript_61688/m.144713 type:complete len:410 (+) Transcript_61688:31-1260(+)
MSNSALVGFCGNFRRHTERQEGTQLAKLLDPVRGRVPRRELGRFEQIEDLAQKYGGDGFSEVLSLYLLSIQAEVRSETVRHLELACTCLKMWVQRYAEAEGTGLWMTPVMMTLTTLARRVAAQLDEAKRSERAERPDQENNACLKKLVAVYREFLKTLNKERTKRAGHVWICSELLRAYFKLGQVSQCSFLLSTVTHSMQKDGFNPTDLPKAICVTFYFFWGKYLVFDHNLQGADEKLTWAFNNCPEKALANRRRILLYLVPCKLRLGVLPTQALLHKYDLDVFVDVVRAIKEGNLQLFNQKMQELAADLIKMGTYLLMMRLKFMVMRQLTKGVFVEVRGRLADKSDKLDFAPFEHIFEWQDGCDADETAASLATLIYSGAVKGYLSHDRRKVVFAKDAPFPPPSKWRV